MIDSANTTIELNRTFSPSGIQNTSSKHALEGLSSTNNHLSTNSFGYKPKIVSLLGSGTATLNNIQLQLNCKDTQKKMFSKTGTNIVEGYSDSKRNNFVNNISQFNSDSKKTTIINNAPIKPQLSIANQRNILSASKEKNVREL